MEELLTPDVRATLEYLPESQGGIVVPTGTGYRAHLILDGTHLETPAEQVLLDRELAYAGDVMEVHLSLVYKDGFEGFLYAGQGFQLSASDKVIAVGTVLEVINSDLKSS